MEEQEGQVPDGLAIAALAVGILATMTSPVLLGVPLGLVGWLLVYLWRRRGNRVGRGFAVAGAVLSAGGLLVSIAAGYFFFSFFQTTMRSRRTRGAENSPIAEWEGVVAPALSLATLDGQTVELEQLKGRRVLLNFWATWCAPCREEIPDIVRLVNETSDDELLVVGVSDESAETIQDYVTREGMNYPQVAGAQDWPAPFDGITSLPTSVFIDRRGVMRKIHVGRLEYADLRVEMTADDWSGSPREAPGVVGPSSLLAAADLDRDGRVNWVFREQGTTLTVASSGGEALARLASDGPFVALGSPVHLLVVQDSATLGAWRLD